jgi:peptidyl-tRNA hydrolase, PTH1 family
MKLIVGLGNPGDKYKTTRHNAGFLALGYYLQDKQTMSCESKFKAEICELHSGDQKLLFIKPQTFMNNSGEAVKAIMDFYKVDPIKDILIVHDEKDLPFGTIRSTDSSSAAGHNGVQSVIDHLGTQDLHRIRIGIESREPDSPIPTEAFVLQNFTDDELQKLETEVLPKVTEAIKNFITRNA